METHENEIAWSKKQRSLKLALTTFFILSLLLLSPAVSFAHCDTMDGPVIKDARIAIEKNKPAYILKWVHPENEAELRDAFILAMKVRKLGPDAEALADKYFFETLIRLHRSGEGVPYTGIKPAGTPVEEKILAADRSIETGSLSPLKGKVAAGMLPELTERFEKVMELKNFDVSNVKAGREYVEAYVRFFKFAEGETEEHGNEHHAHAE